MDEDLVYECIMPFNNISVKWWWSVLLMGEIVVTRETTDPDYVYYIYIQY